MQDVSHRTRKPVLLAPSPELNTMTFPCTGCGLCCQHVNQSALTQWLDSGDGTCVHFDRIDRGCAIYDRRPEICNVDQLYRHFANQHSISSYYEANAQVCNSLQASHGFPLKYRINIGDS
jgi:Fe-S-cluster containining protein